MLTRDHAPLLWRYDLDPKTNPYFIERLGVNAVLNSGAIELNGKFYLVARVEGNDRKSFFAVAESDSPVDGFRFWDKPVELPDTCPEETNVYDMRLTKHADGWIYGVFCSESKDKTDPDLSAAVAAAGIVRTRDLKMWERLPNLVTKRSPQQRNVDLLPDFVNGQYAFYTRPMDGFIDTGSGGGIGFGTCADITHAVLEEEVITSPRRYHTITEAKNGEGAPPIPKKAGCTSPTACATPPPGCGMCSISLSPTWPNRGGSLPSRRAICWRLWVASAWAMCPTSCSPTGPLRAMTARCISTMPPAIRGCMWRPPRWKNCWTMPSTPRRTRCAAATAWPSAAR